MLSLRAIGCLGLLLLTLAGGGCDQSEARRSAEADAHFQKGRALADSEDYKGAAQEFEMTLEDNPHSAAAHFELGWLYDTKLKDYAAAIYHYEKLLLYEPNSKRADLVRDRIRGCKEELGNNEFILPGTRNMQHDLDKLTADNQSLKKQVDLLNKQLADNNLALERARAADPVPVPVSAVSSADPGGPAVTPIPPLAHPHVHVVRAHETLSSIASACGIRTSLLIAANPRVNPRRLRVGQSLNLP